MMLIYYIDVICLSFFSCKVTVIFSYRKSHKIGILYTTSVVGLSTDPSPVGRGNITLSTKKGGPMSRLYKFLKLSALPLVEGGERA